MGDDGGKEMKNNTGMILNFPQEIFVSRDLVIMGFNFTLKLCGIKYL
jgi:hypothetical protein